MVDRKERGTFEWQLTAAIGSYGADATRMQQGAFWSDVTVNTKQEGTRRGKSLVAAGRREVATGVVWACTAS
jgi:hypothetical protein